MRELLIHWLGGITIEEHNKMFEIGVQRQRGEMTLQILNYMTGLYGLSAEEWCKNVYNKVLEINNKLNYE